MRQSPHQGGGYAGANDKEDDVLGDWRTEEEDRDLMRRTINRGM